MKIIIRIAMMITLLITGFAAGVPVGQRIGFTTGSEWALVQADLLAREAGMFMPVHFENGMFRLKLKQPAHLYQRSWQLADRHYEELVNGTKCEGTLHQTAQLTRSPNITQ
jgi:hypothetical protein